MEIEYRDSREHLAGLVVVEVEGDACAVAEALRAREQAIGPVLSLGLDRGANQRARRQRRAVSLQLCNWFTASDNATQRSVQRPS